MAKTRIKEWGAGEVLTADELNAEIDNMNGTGVAFPLTENVSAAGYAISNAVLGTLKQLNENVYCIDNYASFAAAISGIGSATSTLLINKNVNVTANATVPSTLTLWFVGAGKLTVSVACTATINGPIVAGPMQIFAGSGTVALTSNVKLRESDVRWWGVTGDNSTDDLTALQASVSSGAKRLLFPDSTCLVSARIKPASGQEWVGVPGKTILKLATAASSTANLIQLNADGLEGSLDDWSARGIIFDGNGKDAAFVVYGAQRVRFTDCLFRNAGTYGCGLQARPGYSIELAQDDIMFTHCGFEDNGSDGTWDGLDIKYCTNTHLIGCWASGNTDAGMNIRGKDVQLIGCISDGDGTGIRLQANDYASGGKQSYFKATGCTTRNATGVGFQIQADTNNATYVELAACQAITNGTHGLEFSGSGLIYGTASGISSISNTTDGINITGNYIGRFVFSGGLIMSNGGDGVDITGQNTIFDAVQIISNTGTGYREQTGATNNYLMPNCVIDGNGTDIGTRVGSESADGFLAVRTKQSMRAFPGQSSGLELQTDSGGTHSSLVTVGDATSIDLRLMTKGNGNITGYKDNGSRTLFEFREAGSATVNYPDFVASLTGNPVLIQAAGSDTNIDLQLTPKGTGLVRVGTHSALGVETVTGFITIKDAGGTERKIAVVS